MSALYKTLASFDVKVNTAFKLISEINSQISQGKIVLNQKDLGSIYEIAFIKIMTSWEFFLESTFIQYLCGKYTKHSRPKKIIKKINNATAYNVLKGVKTYPDWTNISNVTLLSKLFFSQNDPFEIPLNGISNYYSEMKKVRNAVVHVSKDSSDNFLNLVRSKITAYQPNMTPGEFLIASERSTKKQYIAYYSDILLTTSKLIVK